MLMIVGLDSQVRDVVYISSYLTNGPTNGFSHHYQLDESAFNFKCVRSDFYFLSLFFVEITLCKQNSPRWDAAFSAILFAYVP